jgi:RNA polymerase sigma-70 factor (ECF subfamily)
VVFPSDEVLMRAIQEGHVDLLGSLFTRYMDRVFRRCLHLVGDRHEAEDLLQESFLRVLRYRDSYKGTARFSTWLYRIATNVCFDHLKARSREGAAVENLAETTDFEPLPTDDDRIVVLRVAFERLAPEKRDLLIMTRIRGWGYAKLAAECGATEGAIRVRVHRALQELKSIVDSLQESES